MSQESQQIVVPSGFRGLSKGVRYYVLYEGRGNGRVVLAQFAENECRATLVFLEAERFQYGREKNLIRVLDETERARLPPWLESRANEPFDGSPRIFGVDQLTPSSDKVVVDGREDAIQDAVNERDRILSSQDPCAELNSLAKKKGKNTTRFRLWFITYLAFGENRWALLPPAAGRGTYSREQHAEEGKKTGRHDNNGKNKGCGTTKLSKELMIKGFMRFAAKGRTLVRVHADTVVHLYKARYEKIGDRTVIVQPNPHLPLPPSSTLFGYWVVKLLTHEVVWSTLLGPEEYRNRYLAPRGSFSESLSDFLERVMSDATACPDLPRSYLQNVPSLPLYQVEIFDALTGCGVAIAFGHGGESESMYKEALAFLALPKSLYGRVLGVVIKDDDFPISGVLPRTVQTDNGKGASRAITKLNKEFGVSPERTPSYSPQSNATVEAGHSGRGRDLLGAPVHTVSKLTPIEMARHRYFEFQGRNRSKSVVGRLTPELLGAGIQNPLELARHYVGEGRYRGNVISPLDAITRFLPRVEFEVIQGRLTHNGVVYRPTRVIGARDVELSAREAQAVSQEIFNSKSSKLSGFRFEISNLVEWVMIGKRLVEVGAVAPVAERSSNIAMTERESAAHATQMRANSAESKKLRDAERVRVRVDAMEQTGQPFMAGTQRKGRPKHRTSANRAEIAALKSDS